MISTCPERRPGELQEMSNENLINRSRAADLPGDLAGYIEHFIVATAALRPLFPPERSYQVDFAERTLLRELLAPDDHDNHWWHTGLHIISEGVAGHPALAAEHGPALEALKTQLEQRLGPYQTVTLREINSKSVAGICLLSELMQYPQNSFVAPNAYSLAEALFHATAWYRAIYAGKAPIGFVMLDDDMEKQKYYLWRFMIAPHFQRQGFGARAIELLVGYVKSRPGAKELFVSYIDHEKGPAGFYRRLGFKETGEVDEGEVLMKIELQS